ncbi:4-alpha-glucanotransferase [Desulfovibrio gilichinskyi]|uniref:4-alpha-glucanotransferase n=1 Tax=Desulfovibrio gilichinskyi TaxID=1519643 RepID=A0A1X7D0N8_9BACT|nr:4-alpha-glucanotransferase [Desulfovibrio gilichinskyi]SMF06489.1 4-alpha-glucanotransferase [Desulfovibrio gilichinskyi]
MKRSSGILLHFTSLPSRFGVGDIGPAAYEFADFLAEAGQRFWQVLPITPTSSELCNSPYSGFSAFAANTILISPELMVEYGLLDDEEINNFALPDSDKADFDAAALAKETLLRMAFSRVANNLLDDHVFTQFLLDNMHWLNDFALFTSLKLHLNGERWTKWPQDIRDRTEESLHYWGELLAREILFVKFCQWIFFRQWGQLRDHLAEIGVELIGDIPIYVTHDSSDVWANRRIFKLDENGNSYCVAGVPPDYFSKTGQLWGNPVYNWEILEQEGFGWWVSRLNHNLGLYNWARLDHFRGFSAYWEVPAEAESAIEGYWVPAPGHKLFEIATCGTGCLRIIAEDLGHITPDVAYLRDRFQFPGMSILQFSFGKNIGICADALHNHKRNSVVYTGTHDNNTNRGWFNQDADEVSRKNMLSYLGHDWIDESKISWELIRLLMSSVACLCIFQTQDLLNLGGEARMNIPGEANGNWGWKLVPGQLTQLIRERLGEMTELFGRTSRID